MASNTVALDRDALSTTMWVWAERRTHGANEGDRGVIQRALNEISMRTVTPSFYTRRD